MCFRNKRNHFAMQNAPFWGTLSILFAFGDFCLAERIPNACLGFGGNDFHIHPQLASIVFNDSDISSTDATNISWSVRFCGHVLLRDGMQDKNAGTFYRQGGGAQQHPTKPPLSVLQRVTQFILLLGEFD